MLNRVGGPGYKRYVRRTRARAVYGHVVVHISVQIQPT